MNSAGQWYFSRILLSRASEKAFAFLRKRNRLDQASFSFSPSFWLCWRCDAKRYGSQLVDIRLEPGTKDDALPWWLRGRKKKKKKPTCQCRRHRRCEFDPWVGKISWRRKWQPTPVFLPGKSHGQSLEGYSPRGHKRVTHDFEMDNSHGWPETQRFSLQCHWVATPSLDCSVGFLFIKATQALTCLSYWEWGFLFLGAEYIPYWYAW